jgi:hypothetical protein
MMTKTMMTKIETGRPRSGRIGRGEAAQVGNVAGKHFFTKPLLGTSDAPAE